MQYTRAMLRSFENGFKCTYAAQQNRHYQTFCNVTRFCM